MAIMKLVTKTENVQHIASGLEFPPQLPEAFPVYIPLPCIV